MGASVDATQRLGPFARNTRPTGTSLNIYGMIGLLPLMGMTEEEVIASIKKLGKNFGTNILHLVLDANEYIFAFGAKGGLNSEKLLASAPDNAGGKFALTLPHLVCTLYIMELRFEWDEAKSRENFRKHGVSFDEAQTIFLDENAVRFFDPDHSEDEDRFIMLGMSIRLRVLVVCHCYRQNDAVIRIISARKADKREAEDYWR